MGRALEYPAEQLREVRREQGFPGRYQWRPGSRGGLAGSRTAVGLTGRGAIVRNAVAAASDRHRPGAGSPRESERFAADFGPDRRFGGLLVATRLDLVRPPWSTRPWMPGANDPA
jgi:hypothetical protein